MNVTYKLRISIPQKSNLRTKIQPEKEGKNKIEDKPKNIEMQQNRQEPGTEPTLKIYKSNLKRNRRKGNVAIFGCLLIGLSVSHFELLSHLYPYIASYFHSIDPMVTHSSMRWIPLIWLASLSLSAPLSIGLYNLIGYRKVFTLFLISSTISQGASSFTTNYWIFVPVFSIFGGIAQGGCLILPLYCTWRYFKPKKKALVSGVLLSSYALSSVPSSILAVRIMNPKNMEINDDSYFPKTISDKFPIFLRVFAICLFCIGVLGIIFITEPQVIIETLDDEVNGRESRAGSGESIQETPEFQEFMKRVETEDEEEEEEQIQIDNDDDDNEEEEEQEEELEVEKNKKPPQRFSIGSQDLQMREQPLNEEGQDRDSIGVPFRFRDPTQFVSELRQPSSLQLQINRATDLQQPLVGARMTQATARDSAPSPQLPPEQQQPEVEQAIRRDSFKSRLTQHNSDEIVIVEEVQPSATQSSKANTLRNGQTTTNEDFQIPLTRRSIYLKGGDSTTDTLEQQTKEFYEITLIETKITRFRLRHLAIFKDKQFLNIYFIMFMSTILPCFLLYNFKRIALEEGRSDHFITVSGTMGSIFNALARLFVGLTFKHFGYAFSAYLLMLIEVMSSLLFLPAAGYDWSFIVCLCFFYNSYGGILGLYPLVSDILFEGIGAFTYSILFSSVAISNLVILFIQDWLIKELGGYDNLMLVLLAVSCVPLYNVWILHKRIKRRSLSNLKSISIQNGDSGVIERQGDIMKVFNVVGRG